MDQLGGRGSQELSLSYLRAPEPLKVCVLKETPQRRSLVLHLLLPTDRWGTLGGVSPPDKLHLQGPPCRVAPKAMGSHPVTRARGVCPKRTSRQNLCCLSSHKLGCQVTKRHSLAGTLEPEGPTSMEVAGMLRRAGCLLGLWKTQAARPPHTPVGFPAAL